jgi:hypothetical protein
MKAALCFIISYEHQVNKEKIWQEWIEPNKDIINVYFHYKDFNSIKSPWIKENALPKKYLVTTDYLHIAPAYITLMQYALTHDSANQWFCFLTEACVPIVSPLRFRELFFEHYGFSFMTWRPAWWNMTLLKRANLHYLQPKYHLANTPWFILNRGDVLRCVNYAIKNHKIYNLICIGDVANESLFAIMLESQNSLSLVKNEETTATDWDRMVSKTSPYLFKEGDSKDRKFIDDHLKEKKYTIFLRKVDKSFPDEVLVEYIERGNQDLRELIKRKHRVFWLEKRILALRFYYFLLFFIKKNLVYIGFFTLFLGWVGIILTFPSISTINTCNEGSHWLIC